MPGTRSTPRLFGASHLRTTAWTGDLTLIIGRCASIITAKSPVTPALGKTEMTEDLTDYRYHCERLESYDRYLNTLVHHIMFMIATFLVAALASFAFRFSTPLLVVIWIAFAWTAFYSIRKIGNRDIPCCSDCGHDVRRDVFRRRGDRFVVFCRSCHQCWDLGEWTMVG